MGEYRNIRLTFSLCIISKKRTDNDGFKSERRSYDVICKRDLIKFNTKSYQEL